MSGIRKQSRQIRKDRPKEKVVSSPPGMPALLYFGECVKDRLTVFSVLMEAFQRGYKHPGVNPVERPSDLGLFSVDYEAHRTQA